MTYLKGLWIHDSTDDPVVILSELDAERWEVRKVEIFADGLVSWADSKASAGDTLLGEKPIPPLNEIEGNPELRVAPIGRAEFEVAWSRATATSRQTA